jgi:hypothetical protein
MKVLYYHGLDTTGLEDAVARAAAALERGDFRAAQVKKLSQGGFYRAELNRKDRLLIQLRRHQGEGVILLLEVIRQHAYEKSRFLGGAPVDESRIRDLESGDLDAAPEIPALPAGHKHFRLLDKVLIWDDAQAKAFQAEPPLVLIGSAGSGKTALVLEKLKEQTGSLLYVTLSPYLAEHARRLYHTHGFDREDQQVDFLSLREFLETLQVPEGREATYADFLAWFRRHARSVPELDAHRVHEEFKGVLTGYPVDRPWLDREGYLELGVRQSIFPERLRPEVYGLFEKYLAFLLENGLYEPNLEAYRRLEGCTPRYDFIAVDEVQDITNIQLALLLKTLARPGQFILCGDANQIVHPNFFSWAHLKSFFFRHSEHLPGDLTRILQANYRSSRRITDLANRLLRLKQRRFGSIDRESHYLMEGAASQAGDVVCLKDTEAVRRDLDQKTGHSARFAVIVMRDEDKAEAAVRFKTPLLFSIHEAKGLEYENVILLNIASNQRAIFREIAGDLTGADLDGAFDYRRARDKHDKDPETYKFFVNSLYVAITRAVRNLYWLEQDPEQPFLALMGFGASERALQLAEQRSSAEEWEREARRLAQQGKLEQAQAIERTQLRHQPVPWKVLDEAGLAEAAEKALPPRSVSAKLRERIFEWALATAEPLALQALQAHGYPSPSEALRQRQRLLARLTAPFRAAQPREVWREIEAYGHAYRTPHNFTPLMLAARAGNLAMVETLLDRGADPDARDTRHWTAYHHALDEAWINPDHARTRLPTLHRLLAPESLSLELDGQLLKLDQRQAECFLLQALRVVLVGTLPLDPLASGWPGLTAPDLAELFQRLPPEALPEYRQQRAYLSGLLARLERSREGTHRGLLWRTERGRYTFNPRLQIRLGETFHPIHDLLAPPVLRPYASDDIRIFIETPEIFRPPILRAREAFQAQAQAERAAWMAQLGEQQAQWEAARKARAEVRQARRKAIAAAEASARPLPLEPDSGDENV